MAFDRAAAKQAGYSDEEIDAFLKEQEREQREPPGAEPPPPSTVIPEVSSVPSALATTGLGLAEIAGPAAGAYGAYKLGRYGIGKAIDAVADKVASRMPAPVAATPVAPVAPAAATPVAPPATSPILDAQGRPMVRTPTAPVAPVAAAPGPVVPPGGPAPVSAAPSGGVINRATDIVKQLALQKVAPALGAAARIAGPVGLGYSIYEASPYIQQGGQELASGAAQNRMREAQRSVLNAPTPAPLTRQEAQNLIASGDQRLIGIYRNDPEVARLLSGQ